MAASETATIHDFDVRILKAGSDAYLVTAQAPGTGLAHGTLDWQALASDDFTAQLRQIKDEPYSTDEALFRSVGEALFQALFQDEVRDLFLGFFQQRVQSEENTYLRLRLDIMETAVEVAMLPWEFLSWNEIFFATHVKTLFTRQFLDMKVGNLKTFQIEGQPRVLIVIPSGSGLQTDKEKETVIQALQNAGIAYDVLDGNVTVGKLDDYLASKAYHMMHFIGHGEFREEDDGKMHGSLRFNADGEMTGDATEDQWVTDTHLRSLLANYESLRLVVLNACKGAEVAAKGSGAGFIGTAPALLRAGVPAVVAMQYSILDPVALQFAETFYKRLTEPGPWAGHVDIALTAARNACYLQFPRDRGFASPVLYLRASSGQIFELGAKPKSDEAPAGPEAEKATGCEQPPKPVEETLYKYRHSQVDTMAAAAKAVQQSIEATQLNIQRLRTLQAENPVLAAAERADIAIPKLEAKLEEANNEMDEMVAVIRWKLYELCEKIAQEEEALAASKAKVADLQAQNRVVPAGMKGDIARRSELLRKLKVRREKAEEFLQISLIDA